VGFKRLTKTLPSLNIKGVKTSCKEATEMEGRMVGLMAVLVGLGMAVLIGCGGGKAPIKSTQQSISNIGSSSWDCDFECPVAEGQRSCHS